MKKPSYIERYPVPFLIIFMLVLMLAAGAIDGPKQEQEANVREKTKQNEQGKENPIYFSSNSIEYRF